MNKIEIINNIRSKIFGDVKNKVWFKKYKYKDVKIDDYIAATITITAILGSLIIAFLPNKYDNLGLAFLFSYGIASVLGTLTTSCLNKIMNRKNKSGIKKFIKKPEGLKSSEMVGLMNKNEKFKGSSHLVNFIKSQPLEKKDIDYLNEVLIKNFSKNELDHLAYNEVLNKKLKNKGNIDYDYVSYALNLLEINENQKNKGTIIDNIKSNLYQKKRYEEKFKFENNVEKVISYK